MKISLLWRSFRFFVVLTLFGMCTSSMPRIRNIEIPFFEEQPKGTELYNLKKNLSADEKAAVRYQLTNQRMNVGGNNVDWVSLEEKTGIITVNRPVDREKDCSRDTSEVCLILVTVVRRPQSYHEIIKIRLEIVDVNDHAPIFPVQPVISVNISEASPVNTRISLTKYLATDADIGRNSMIYYSLTRNNHFNLHNFNDAVDGTAGLELVVTDELDYEQDRVYELTLTANDRGMPISKSDRVTLRVNILDANDNRPVFDKKIYSLKLKENLSSGSLICTVHAEDADDGVRREVRYYVPSLGNSRIGKNLIDVDAVTGNIVLKRSVDSEKHNNIRIVVGARDLGREKRLTGKTILEIQVEDENDNAPVIDTNVVVEFDHDTAFLVESAKIGTYVALVSANDADDGLGGKVAIEISTSLLPVSMTARKNAEKKPVDVSKYFALRDGLITTGRLFDRETQPGFLINIFACDMGTPIMCSSKNLTIKLLDENDHAPQFHKTETSIDLREDVDVGTLITTVTASDGDSIYLPALKLNKNLDVEESRNGVVRYNLFNGGGCFSIDEISGQIRLVGALDYEKQKNWELVVMARDEGEPSLSSNLSLFIKVTDVNDNRPVFSNPSVNNLTVPATIQSGKVITKINAIDYDQGMQSDVWYSITIEDEGDESPRKFIIDQFNGNLRLNMSNPELKEMVGSHTIMVKAQDLGNPPLNNFITILVEVYDVPYSQLPKYIKHYEEPATSGGEYMIILIGSLTAATLLMILVLAAVILKCKRESKEIRTYNCRSAEKNLWHPSNSHLSLPISDAMVMSSHPLYRSQDSNLHTFNLANINQRSDLSRAGSMSSVSQKTVERKLTSFRKETRRHPATLQVDRDSGRGDSDHDTGSCDDKELLFQEKPPQLSEQRQHIVSQSSVSMETSDEDNMGPLCTHLCRQYGHSDACWMPVADEYFQNSRYTPYNDLARPTTPSRTYLPYITNNYGGLETISETQPLHSVLGDGDGNSVVDSIAASQTLLDEWEREFYPNARRMPCSSSWNQPSLQDPSLSVRPTSAMSQHHQDVIVTRTDADRRRHSLSEKFHDCVRSSPSFPVSSSTSYHCPSITSPLPITPSYRRGSYTSNSRSQSPGSRVPSRISSTKSLRDDLVHSRFNETPRTSSGDASTVIAYCDEMSMEETQRIIHDIDQLVDH